MCGIAGCFLLNGCVNKEKFEKMVDIIAHRGPDDKGLFFEGSLALGHRRLSIIDLSKQGHQPFLYRNKYAVVYNGEIYNYRELKIELEQKGYVFETKTDTEVLIAAYDCYGDNCVQRFNGMWSFAIYDRKKQQLFCSRDRFGVKPFYYSFQRNQFLFGSEIKQILCMSEEPIYANKQKLLEFLIRGMQDHTTETMFEGIYQLGGGYNLLLNIKNGQLGKH